jgi:peptidoglycan-associated lipoprotein
LTGRARDELLTLAARLRAHPEYHIHIVGHADARGTREFNRDLGSRRAQAVFELLTRAGVARQQLETESRGEEQPRAVGTSESVWAVNRRVEITIGSERE